MSYPPEILEASYEECRRVAGRARSNFTPCFRLLSNERRRAMETLYAFMRHTDDLVDGEASQEEAAQALAGWREATRAALSGSSPETNGKPDILPAVANTVERFEIAQAHILDAIDGAEMDLSQQRYDTFEELSQYCYRVASVVGLACLRIWGYRGEEPSPAAHACGLAFQLTNILRDVREDYERGRVYLPQEDLQRFGVSETEFGQSGADEPFRELMRFEAQRAGRYYHEAAVLAEGLEGEGRRIFLMMIRVYYGLLKRIEAEPERVLSQHIRLGRWHVATIMIRTLLRPSARAVLP